MSGILPASGNASFGPWGTHLLAISFSESACLGGCDQAWFLITCLRKLALVVTSSHLAMSVTPRDVSLVWRWSADGNPENRRPSTNGKIRFQTWVTGTPKQVLLDLFSSRSPIVFISLRYSLNFYNVDLLSRKSLNNGKNMILALLSVIFTVIGPRELELWCLKRSETILHHPVVTKPCTK